MTPEECLKKWAPVVEKLDVSVQTIAAHCIEQEVRYLTEYIAESTTVSTKEMSKWVVPATLRVVSQLFAESAVDRLARVASYPPHFTLKEVQATVDEAFHAIQRVKGWELTAPMRDAKQQLAERILQNLEALGRTPTHD